MAYTFIQTAEFRISDHFKFKNQQLNQFSEQIARIYSNAASYADAKNREMACILADVMESKCYTDDGFDSVASYAAATFGIAKSNAYQLARAGQVYRNPNAPEQLKAMTPSKLSELSTVPDEIVFAAVESGEIKSDTTQKKLRDFASAHKSESLQLTESDAKEEVKAEILKQYTPRMIPAAVAPELIELEQSHRTMPEWETTFSDYIKTLSHGEEPEIITLPKTKATPESKTKTVLRTLFATSISVILVEFREYRETKTKKPTPAQGLKFSKAQLLEMLAKLEEFEKVSTEPDEQLISAE